MEASFVARLLSIEASTLRLCDCWRRTSFQDAWGIPGTWDFCNGVGPASFPCCFSGVAVNLVELLQLILWNGFWACFQKRLMVRHLPMLGSYPRLAKVRDEP